MAVKIGIREPYESIGYDVYRRLEIRCGDWRTLRVDGPTTVVSLPGRMTTRLMALVDSGAECHFINVDVGKRYGLDIIRCDHCVEGIGGRVREPMPVFDSGLILRDAGDLPIKGPLTGMPGNSPPVVLGRPLLAQSRTLYDGPNGLVVLDIDDEFDPTDENLGE